ncbi:MAG TPA: helix-turn-helix domain-containing protein [Mucilaginibacter sp.]|jgi:AraC-like DNA-binding protein|nr:helix-turn-helix domain-containing protein [Mucilaginibacter sp.]
MNYCIYKPPKTLSNVVRHYWSLDGNVPTGQTYFHRTLANFCPELIFHYGGTFEELAADNSVTKTFTTGIHGQTSQIRRFTAKEKYGIFGVLLQPYALATLFGISSGEFKNELVDLALLGQSGKDIAHQILSAKNNAQRLQLINVFLQQRLRAFDRPEIVYATHRIYHLNGLVNVKALADESCLSQRQFERKFMEHVGFSPKSFARIVRFRSLINNYKRQDSTLTKAAYDFGYYDQAHFIQDFKQFSGYNPHTYFSGGAKDVFYAP